MHVRTAPGLGYGGSRSILCVFNTHTRTPNSPRADLARGLDETAHVIHVNSYVIFFTQESFLGDIMWKRQLSKGFMDRRSAFAMHNHRCGAKSNPTLPSGKKDVTETDVWTRIGCSWGLCEDGAERRGLPFSKENCSEDHVNETPEIHWPHRGGEQTRMPDDIWIKTLLPIVRVGVGGNPETSAQSRLGCFGSVIGRDTSKQEHRSWMLMTPAARRGWLFFSVSYCS